MTPQIKREEPTEGKLMYLPICWDWDVGQTAEVHILQILKQTWSPDSPYLACPALYPELSSSRAGLPLPQGLFHIYIPDSLISLPFSLLSLTGQECFLFQFSSPISFPVATSLASFLGTNELSSPINLTLIHLELAHLTDEEITHHYSLSYIS